MPPALVAASSPWPFCASPQGKHKAVMDGRKGLPARLYCGSLEASQSQLSHFRRKWYNWLYHLP